MKWFVYGMLALTACLLFAGCASNNAASKDDLNVFTQRSVDLKKDMTYQQVVQIMKQEGQPYTPKPDKTGASAPAMPAGITMYEWKNKNGSIVRCTFKDGKLLGPTTIAAEEPKTGK